MLHLEGYALYRPEVAEAAVAAARAAGALVSLDLASFELVRFLRADVLRFLARVDLVFCNEVRSELNYAEGERQLNSPVGLFERVIKREKSLGRIDLGTKKGGAEKLGCGNWGGVQDEAAVLVGAEEFVGAEGGVPDEVVAKAVAFLREHCAPGAVVTVSRGRQGCVTAGGDRGGACLSLCLKHPLFPLCACALRARRDKDEATRKATFERDTPHQGDA